MEGAGIEHLTLSIKSGQVIARSVVIGERGGCPYGARYMIICDAGWVIHTLDLETTAGQTLSLVKDGDGRWTDQSGIHLPRFDGCIHIDLAGTPFTNTLPIRRLDLDVHDGPVELKMLYVPFDTFTPIVDEQRYRCPARRSLYRYEAVDRSFSADLPVDPDGLADRLPRPVRTRRHRLIADGSRRCAPPDRRAARYFACLADAWKQVIVPAPAKTCSAMVR